MKVLHVIPGVAPRYGGPSHAIFAMARALQERGEQVLVATTDADGPERLLVELGVPFAYEGVQTIFFTRQWSEAFKYSRPLARWLNANVGSFDVVHIHAVFSHACLAAARACRRHNVPYMVRPVGALDPSCMGRKQFRKQLFWHLGVRKMLSRAAAIHYTTAEEMRAVEGSLRLSNGCVVPLALDLDGLREQVVAPDFRLRQRLGDDPFVLSLSRLHPIKNLELLIKAFLGLTAHQEFARWRLVLAGAGDSDYVEKLKRMVRESGQTDRVLFAGWLDGAQKAAALREAALMALPSHHENFGVGVAEAMSCGVPVLVSPHVNLAAEVSRAGAGWVAPLDAGGFAEVLADALSDEKERQRRGRAAHGYVRRFAAPQVAAELMRMYSTAAGNSPV